MISILKNTKTILITLILLFTLSTQAQDGDSSSGQTQSGLTIKGGLWGLGGSIKSELEDKYFTDDLLSGFGIGQFNTSWSNSNRFYPLNPIGLDYYIKGMGPGSLLLGAEMRGIPGFTFAGYNPKYSFTSFTPGGTIGLHEAELKFRNLDLNIGYQMAMGNFLITPKFQFRNFVSDLKESGTYISRGGFGIRDSRNLQNTWSGFLGVNLLYQINQVSSVFFEFAMDSPIFGQISNSGSFSKTTAFGSGNSISGSVNLVNSATQEIRGTVFDFGYQHSFGALGLRLGYRAEELRTTYSSYTDIPLFFNNSGNAGVSIEETILNSILYKNNSSTMLQSLYITATYKL